MEQYSSFTKGILLGVTTRLLLGNLTINKRHMITPVNHKKGQTQENSMECD